MSSLGRGPPPSSNNTRYNDYDYYDSYDYQKKNSSSSSNRPPKKLPFYSSRRDFALKPSGGLPPQLSSDPSRRFSRGTGAYGSYGNNNDRSSSGGFYLSDRYGGYGNKPWRSSSSSSGGGYGSSSQGSNSLINSTSLQQPKGPGIGEHDQIEGSRSSPAQNLNNINSGINSSMSSNMNFNTNQHSNSSYSPSSIQQQAPHSMSSMPLYRKERYDSYTGSNSAGAPQSRYNGTTKERTERQDRPDRPRPQDQQFLHRNSGDSYYPTSRNSSTGSIGFKERDRDRDRERTRDRDRERDWYKARGGGGSGGPFSFDSQRIYDEYDYLHRDISSYPNGDKDEEFSYPYNNTDGEEDAVPKHESLEEVLPAETESVPLETKIDGVAKEKEHHESNLDHPIVEAAEETAKGLREAKEAIEVTKSVPSIAPDVSNMPQNVVEAKVEEIVVKPEAEVKKISPGKCIYPLNRIETQYLKLQKDFESAQIIKGCADIVTEKFATSEQIDVKSDKISDDISKTPVKFSLKDYPFFNSNIERYFSMTRTTLSQKLSEKYNIVQKKRILLWKSSEIGYKNWDKKCADMTQQLEVLHPEDDELKKELASIDIRGKLEPKSGIVPEESLPVQTGGLPTASRRNRRHGDLVTTEAEFQEILKSLEKQLADDPLIHAQHVSAKIPDMILDPVERHLIPYMDSNNYVTDRLAWSRRIFTDFEDNFSQEEHELFCEGYCLHPKKFGAISRHMGGLRTPEECVIHYYVSKKGVNYKQLLAQFKKKASKKNSKRKPGKSRNTSLSTTPVSTPAVETAGHESGSEVGLEMPAKHLEEYFTDTGRRKRTAATALEPDERDASKKKAKKKEALLESPVEFQKPVSLGTEKTVDKSVDPVDSNKITESESGVASISNNSDPIIESVAKSEPVKRQVTSYWTAFEISRFPSLLEEFGMDWNLIAKTLETKTNTMVKNYYQRNVEKFASKMNSDGNGTLALEPVKSQHLKTDSSRAEQNKPSTFTDSSSQGPGRLSAIMNPENTNEQGPKSLKAPNSSLLNVPNSSVVSDKHGTQSLNDGGPNFPRAFVSSHRLTSINSLLSTEEMTNTQHRDTSNGGYSHQNVPQDPPQRSSIMSLLNSDSSPAKPPAAENIGSTRPTPHISSLTALLNSSESPSGNGLSNLLSASHAPDNVS